MNQGSHIIRRKGRDTRSNCHGVSVATSEQKAASASIGMVVCRIFRILSRVFDDIVDTLHWYCIRWWQCRSKGVSWYLEKPADDSRMTEPLIDHTSWTDLKKDWDNRVSTSFSQENDSHALLLKRLWVASFGEREDGFAMKHSVWKSIGFQSETPASDFRGGGLLSLECLVYMAEHYPGTYLSLALETTQEKSNAFDEYPFAASCIAMVFYLIDSLDLRRTDTQLSRYSYGFWRAAKENENLFQEIVVHSMICLDRVWQRTNASYMEFPKVSRSVCSHVRHIVGKRWFMDPSVISKSIVHDR
jgi:hypothetical protein